MRIVVIGTGYVGLVTGACLAQAGHHVTCVDIDDAKIATLNNGGVPIFEPGLAELIGEGRRSERLSFASEAGSAARAADLVFITVGTPSRECDGHADLSFVHGAVREIAPVLKPGCLVVVKSTVPVGTGDEIERAIAELRPGLAVDVASNPEFLRAGSAIADFRFPDRVVIGAESAAAGERLAALYRMLAIDAGRIVVTSRRSAELIKYAANGFLATKIAFINEIADLCEKVGARVSDVATGIGLDRRIGIDCLRAGPGFGGSCFPKDARALAKMSEDNEAPARIIEAVLAANEARKRTMVRKIAQAVGDGLRGKTIGLLGLTFKAGTDDMRDAPSIPLIHALIDHGASVAAYDPIAVDRARMLLPGSVRFCTSPYEAMAGVHAGVVVTEWDQFLTLDFRRLRRAMARPVLVDLRNLLGDVDLCGFHYVGLGNGRISAPQPLDAMPRTRTETARMANLARRERRVARRKVLAAE